MFNQGTIAACKTAMVVFAVVFLVCMIKGLSVFGASLRGSEVALVAFIAAKVLYHLFFSALFDELSEFVRKGNNLRKQ